MSEPQRPQLAPYEVQVEKGNDYWGCACGASASQPFCDGSHKGTEFGPVQFTAPASGPAYFCGCKGSGSSPMCDGSHKALS